MSDNSGYSSTSGNEDDREEGSDFNTLVMPYQDEPLATAGHEEEGQEEGDEEGDEDIKMRFDGIHVVQEWYVTFLHSNSRFSFLLKVNKTFDRTLGIPKKRVPLAPDSILSNTFRLGSGTQARG